MSHRLEKNSDTKYPDYSEPETSARQMPTKRSKPAAGKPSPESAKETLDIARKSESGRGSFSDEQRSVENTIKGLKPKD